MNFFTELLISNKLEFEGQMRSLKRNEIQTKIEENGKGEGQERGDEK